MPRRTAARTPTIAERVLEGPQDTLLDTLDHLLNKGVVVSGDIALGVAGVDLIYLRLSALLCAVDRVLPPADDRGSSSRRRSRSRRRGGR